MLVQYDTVPRTYIQDFANLEEMGWYISGPHNCVVHAPDIVIELAYNGIKPLVVSITTDQMSLSRYLVLIPTPLC